MIKYLWRPQKRWVSAYIGLMGVGVFKIGGVNKCIILFASLMYNTLFTAPRNGKRRLVRKENIRKRIVANAPYSFPYIFLMDFVQEE